MKCYLMNQNKKITYMEYDEDSNTISHIYEIINIDYSPLSLYNAYKDKSKNLKKELNNWFRGRGIPSWRKDIERLLERLNISSTNEILNKAYALSLSDQYWIKPENENISWEDINFFNNDFKYKGYLMVSLSSSQNIKPEIYSPNNTTDGMLQKAWVIEGKNRILVKSTYTASRQEPINEWLASAICERLGFEHCHYGIDIIDNKIVSKCINFIKDDEEIITAIDVYKSKKKENHISDFEHYIQILEEHNVPNARQEIENMFFLDSLILNKDRHMKNYGIIRNVKTLEWSKVVPIFDNGQSMQCEKLTYEIDFTNDYGKFFSNVNKSFNDYLNYIQDPSRFDLNKLDGIVVEFKEKLKKYQMYTDMNSERIDKLSIEFEKRIEQMSIMIDNIIKKRNLHKSTEFVEINTDIDEMEM